MFVPFSPPEVIPEAIDLRVSRLPYYLARSTLRMFIALPLSLGFSILYGYVAAHSRRAEKLLVPALDILQSVPVLGFLSVTVTFFIGLFRGNLLGLEAASIFAVFTGQAWNMTFAFYHSLRTLPSELKEACRLYQLNRWQTFKRLEMPAAAIPLVWNTMMSFGGGWFFVSASESITVLNGSYTLPGIGAYVAAAIKVMDLRAVGYAIAAIAFMIVMTDQLLWQPLLAWSHKFKLDTASTTDRPASWLYDAIQASRLPTWGRAWAKRWRTFASRLPRPTFRPQSGFDQPTAMTWVDQGYLALLIGGVGVLAYFGIHFILVGVSLDELLATAGLAAMTFLRVLVLVVFSSAIWVPIGVAIGFRPKLAQIGQPAALFMASFPANFMFPFATALFVRWSVPIGIGSAMLMAFGTQWYVLFNIIGGAQAIPGELREMARTFGLRRWQLWRNLILPGIFPAWVTGAITAAGGAWNASIVAECVTWGKTTLRAEGLGSYIAAATEKGDWPRIALGVGMMSLFVVVLNRALWARLYEQAARRFAF